MGERIEPIRVELGQGFAQVGIDVGELGILERLGIELWWVEQLEQAEALQVFG